MRREMPPGGPVPDPEREVREEIEHYLEERARELVEQGVDPEQARVQASRAFGNVARIEAEVGRIRRGRRRDQGRTRMMESIRQDLKLAFRGLMARPGFAAIVIATLALGIGAVTAIFSVANAALLEALPFDDGDDLVFVQGAYDAPEGPQVRGASYPEFLDWQAAAVSFTAMSAHWSQSLSLTGTEGPAQRLQAELVGDGYFDALTVSPLIGRLFQQGELVVPGTATVTLMGEALWVDRFGRDPEVLGTTIYLNGTPFTVVGVLPQSFTGTALQTDLWLPLGAPELGIDADRAGTRDARWLRVLARLRAGRGLEGAQSEMDGIASRLEAAHPETHEDRIAVVTPMRDFYMGETRTLILLVLTASGLLLVIAGANVANLLLVRTTGRGAEVLMKKALGAGPGRLVSQFLTESMFLAGLGALAGLVVGAWGAKALVALMPDALLPAYVDVELDALVFVVTVLLMAGVGALAGLAPAVLAARGDVGRGLREGGSSTFGRSRIRIQRALVAGEIGLAILLLVGAGLMTKSFRAQMEVRTGFDHADLYAFRVSFPPDPYSGETLRTAVAELEERLQEAPGITEATFGGSAPLRGGYSASYLFTDTRSERIRFYLHRVAPDWFGSLGTEIRQGRALDRADTENPSVTVVSQALASRFFAGQDPVGRSIRIGGPDGREFTIVGVAEDVRFRDLTTDLVGGEDDPDIYLPWLAFATRTVDFVVRAAGDPAALERTVRETVATFDPDLAVYLPQPMAESLRTQTAQARFGSLLLLTFGATALVLAIVGLYGVLAYTVDQRKREIALRMAIGAEASTVRRMVVGEGLRLTIWGLVPGLAVAVLGSRALDSFLYGVERLDAVTYAQVAIGAVVVSALAALLPALRATKVNPQGALKAE